MTNVVLIRLFTVQTQILGTVNFLEEVTSVEEKNMLLVTFKHCRKVIDRYVSAYLDFSWEIKTTFTLKEIFFSFMNWKSKLCI